MAGKQDVDSTLLKLSVMVLDESLSKELRIDAGRQIIKWKRVADYLEKRAR